MSNNLLTTSSGMPVDDNQNSLTAGEYGPVLIQDFHLIDKLAKFDRERIPERVVHAQGSGAHGYLEITHDVSKYCRADIFKHVGEKTPAFLRFSTVIGQSGTSDSDRDPRGFALKVYTKEGNWDIVGNNTPIFFIRDPMKFPDFIHSLKRDPETGLKNPDNFWDFISQTPEANHQLVILFSDRGTPYGFRHMHGYGSHTFRWVNDKNEAFYVKYHFVTEQGVKNLTDQESAKLRSDDPDLARRDLRESIAKKQFPAWKFMVQIMPEKDAEKYHINIFDVTKVWPHGDYPLIPVGRLVLDRNPTNYFAEVEQSAFSPAHMIPGIEPSFDKMLQGRLFSYNDTHRHRLGGNFDQIPINCPYRSRVNSGERDGFLRVNGNHGAKKNYEPNTPQPFTFTDRSKISTLPLRGQIGRFKPAHPNNDFAQGGTLYRKIMKDIDREHLVYNLWVDMKGAQQVYQERQLRIWQKVDPELAGKLGQKLGISAVKPKL